MQNIWSTSVPPHEKVKHFTEELNKFRSLLKRITEPVKVPIHQQAETVKPSCTTSTKESRTLEIDGTIAQGLAKVNRKMGSILLDFLKIHPDKLMWNEKREMIYQWKTFYGSNMKNLISNVMTNRAKPSSQTFNESAPVKTLAYVDVA